MFIRALHPRVLFLFSPDEGGNGAGGEGGNEGGGGAATATTFTQEQVNALIAKEKGRISSKYGDYDDLKAAAQKLQEIENASKSDLEKLNGNLTQTASERDALKTEKAELALKLARYDAAAKAGLDPKHAGRIQGGTPEEMEADAKSLANEFGGARESGFDGGPRGSGGGKQPQSMDALIRRASGRT